MYWSSKLKCCSELNRKCQNKIFVEYNFLDIDSVIFCDNFTIYAIWKKI